MKTKNILTLALGAQLLTASAFAISQQDMDIRDAAYRSITGMYNSYDVGLSDASFSLSVFKSSFNPGYTGTYTSDRAYLEGYYGYFNRNYIGALKDIQYYGVIFVGLDINTISDLSTRNNLTDDLATFSIDAKYAETSLRLQAASYRNEKSVALNSYYNVPEPSTYGLIGIGALGVAFAARRRKQKTA